MYFVKKNTKLILVFSFAISGTSGAIERVFSITNDLWTDKKNRFLVEAIKAVTVTSTKYKASVQEERTPPSTLTGN
jgi:hypothetical protein